MTKTKERTTETVERELEDVQTRLLELRTELRGLHDAPSITWDGASPETVAQIAEVENRRTALPHLIAAGEIRELELRRELIALRLPQVEEEIEKRHRALERAEAKLKEAQDKRNEAHFAWSDAIDHRRDIWSEGLRLDNEIADRKAAAERDRKALAAPVVRSVWQQRTRELA